MTDPVTSYSGYVLAAYLVALVLVVGLVAWTVLGARSARRAMQEVEAKSVSLLGRQNGPAARSGSGPCS